MAHYRAAVLGCGNVSREHILGYLDHPRTQLVALAEIDEHRLQEAGKQHSIDHLYTDYHQLLEQERPNIVSICTSARLHRDMTVAAASYGAHVLCEKPMATDLAQADDMINACDKAGVRLAINHQQRCSPYFRKARELIEQGRIGTLLSIRDRGKNRLGGYEMIEIGTHLFDAMRYFAGDVESVFGHLRTAGRDTEPGDVVRSVDVDPDYRDMGLVAGDDAFAYFTFKSGVNATAEFYHRPGKKPTSGPRLLIGTTGILAISPASNWGLELHYYPEPVLRAASQRGWQAVELSDEELALYGQVRRPNEIFRSIDEMVQCLDEERDHISSGRSGRAALEMAMAVYSSHFSHSRILLPLTERRHPLQAFQLEHRP